MNRFLGSAGILLATLVFSALASADTVWSGNAVASCQPTGGSPSFGWAGVMNASTSQGMYVDCGTLASFESTEGGDEVGPHVLGVVAFIWDLSTTENAVCNMQVLDATGTVWYSGAQKQTTGSSATNIKNVNWYPGGSLTGYPYVSCYIPKASGSSYSGISGIVTNG